MSVFARSRSGGQRADMRDRSLQYAGGDRNITEVGERLLGTW